MGILVRIPNWLGDVVQATPTFRAIREAFPSARITAFGKPGLLELLDGSGLFDDTRVVGARGGPIRDGLALRGAGYAKAVLLPASWSSAIAAFCAGIPERYGYAEDGRGVLLTHRLRSRMWGRLRPVPKVDHYLYLARLLGCEVDPASLPMAIPVQDRAREGAERWLGARGVGAGERIVALSVGAGFGPAKEWLPGRWAEVADHFLAAGARVIVYGAPKDRPAVRAVLTRCARPGAIEATDVPLLELPAHMARAGVLISTDAGGRHVGIAVGTPTVVIMGSTHPGYSECYAPHYAVLLDRPACWPCHLRRCPIDHRCMTAIQTARVVAAAEAFLAGRRPFGGRRPWATPPGREHPLFRGAAC